LKTECALVEEAKLAPVGVVPYGEDPRPGRKMTTCEKIPRAVKRERFVISRKSNQLLAFPALGLRVIAGLEKSTQEKAPDVFNVVVCERME